MTVKCNTDGWRHRGVLLDLETSLGVSKHTDITPDIISVVASSIFVLNPVLEREAMIVFMEIGLLL